MMKREFIIMRPQSWSKPRFAKVITLLALLITAATGAWAQDTYKIDAVYTINGQSGSQDFSIDDASLPFTKKLSELDPNGSSWIENNLDAAYITVSGDNIVKGTDANWDTEITINGAGTATVSYVIQLTGYVEVGTATITFTVTKNEAPAAPKHLVTATFDKQTRLLEQALPYATTIGELYEAVTGQSFSDLISRMSALESPLNEITSLNPSVVIIGELNGASTPVTVIADGQATVSFKFGNYAQGIYVSVTPPLYVTMKDGTQDADKWTVKVGEGEAQALPIGGLKGDGTEAVTLKYNGRLKVKSVTATADAQPAWDGDLSKLTAESTAAFATATDGVTISGTLAANVKVSIADGATVTLAGVTILGTSVYGEAYNHAGITCEGNATIILADDTENTVKGFYDEYPGIYVPAGSTLTIQGGTAGTGTLTASSNGYAAGIGGGFDMPCGHITITGGTVTATGGDRAAGIGSGSVSSCGNITIASTVTKVTATKGSEAYHSIGAGFNGTCGTVTIGGTKYWENDAAVNDDAATYLAQAKIVYPAPAGLTLDLATVTEATTVEDGYTVTGALAEGVNVKISIAAGATVTLDGVTINGEDDDSYNWAGINCLGDATIILKDGTTNTVKGFYEEYPGIHVPQNNTLTIQGSGSLTASSNGWGAGIGGGYKINCGNIVIAGGNITATGGGSSAGIGSGEYGSCGTITITDGVTSVTATKGDDADYSIGAGNDGSCGTVTIGCSLDSDGNIISGTGSTGQISTSPYTYQPSN